MRPASWASALIGLALCASAFGQGRFEEFDERLQDIEKQLKLVPELERGARAAGRRMTEMEDTIRQLRSKLDLLELQMKHLQGTLTVLRKEVARLGGDVAAVTSPGTTQGEPEPAPQPAEAPATIRTQDVAAEGDLLTVSGTVANPSEKPVSFIVIEATFLDARGNVVKTESGYTSPRVIAPGATATFKIVTRRDARISDHRLKVRAP